MRIFSILIVVLFFVLQIPLVYANCADAGRQANDSFAAVVTAKDIYKEEVFRALKKPLSIEGLSAAIGSTERFAESAWLVAGESRKRPSVFRVINGRSAAH